MTSNHFHSLEQRIGQTPILLHQNSKNIQALRACYAELARDPGGHWWLHTVTVIDETYDSLLIWFGDSVLIRANHKCESMVSFLIIRITNPNRWSSNKKTESRIRSFINKIWKPNQESNLQFSKAKSLKKKVVRHFLQKFKKTSISSQQCLKKSCKGTRNN